MKNILIVIATFVLVPTASAAFTDVPNNHPYAEAIDWAQKEGIIEGYADGTFKPDALVNRAEFVKILVEIVFEKTNSDEYTNSFYEYHKNEILFSDVQSKDWFKLYVYLAYSFNWVQGYDDGTFRPGNDINAAEAYKIIALATDQVENNPAKLDSALLSTEQTGKPWYQPYADYLSERNAIPASIISVSKAITRGEMVEMMFRLSGSNPKLSPETVSAAYLADGCNWKTLESNGWQVNGWDCYGLDTTYTLLSSANGFEVALPNRRDTVIEVFTKKPEDTAEQTIEKIFIGDKERSNNCYASLNLDQSMPGISIKRYEIYTTKEWSGDNFEPCGRYGTTNGIQYFEFHEDSPDSFLFVRIGQDSPPFDRNSIKYMGD